MNMVFRNVVVMVMILAVCAIAPGCGSDVPAEVADAKQESIKESDERFEAERTDADAEYDRTVEAIESAFAEAKAYADEAITSEAKQMRMRQAEDARDSALDAAKQARVEHIEEAESTRAKEIQKAESQVRAVVNDAKRKQFLLDKGIQLEELQAEYCRNHRVNRLARAAAVRTFLTDSTEAEIPTDDIGSKEFDTYNTEWDAWRTEFLRPYARPLLQSQESLDAIWYLAREELGIEVAGPNWLRPTCEQIMDVSESDLAPFDTSGAPRLADR